MMSVVVIASPTIACTVCSVTIYQSSEAGLPTAQFFGSLIQATSFVTVFFLSHARIFGPSYGSVPNISAICLIKNQEHDVFLMAPFIVTR